MILPVALPATATGETLPDPDDPPWEQEPIASHATVNPGDKLYNLSCTLGFLYRNATGAWFGSTAGHCVDHVGQPVYLGPLDQFFFQQRKHPRIGTVVAYRDDPPNGDEGRLDWALIELDPPEGVRIEPQLRHWTGPTGVFRGQDLPHYQDRVCYYGWGQAYKEHDATRSRCGRFNGFLQGGDRVVADFRGFVDSGDSGMPIIHYPSGQALAMVLSGLYYPMNSGVTVCSFLHMTADAGYDLSLATAGYDPPRPWPTVADPVPPEQLEPTLTYEEDTACPN